MSKIVSGVLLLTPAILGAFLVISPVGIAAESQKEITETPSQVTETEVVDSPPPEHSGNSDFSWDLENLSPNLSPALEKALNSPPSLAPDGAGGIGLALIFPHDVKSQSGNSLQSQGQEKDSPENSIQRAESELSRQSAIAQPVTQ